MSTDEKPSINVRPDAFLRAANIPQLVNSDGQQMEAKPVAALCRCGLSANKPYCDGNHKKLGFDGAAGENAARDKVYTYEGAEADVHYAKLLCSHAGECGARLPTVFAPSERPWVKPDNATVAEIEKVVQACPSGALRYSLKGATSQHILPDETGIVVEKNGPYRVFNIPLVGQKFSDAATPSKYVLCRCGLSKNKPFCDGTHHDAGWRDDA